MAKIKALAFDVGGSVFDWKGATTPVIAQIAANHGVALDAEEFAMNWRLEMFLTLGRLHKGEIEHCNMDVMLRIGLDNLLERHPEFNPTEAEIADLMRCWHRMDCWDEFKIAIERMKTKYTVAILSVLSFSILVDSSKYAGLAWDAIISCEFLSCYKQKPEAYTEGAALLGLKPEEICFVAVHPSDILSAKKTGMRTAYVAPKADEPDVPGLVMPYDPNDYDFNAETYLELCDQLGC